eukprot:3403429-Amphidinium_carterae.1
MKVIHSFILLMQLRELHCLHIERLCQPLEVRTVNPVQGLHHVLQSHRLAFQVRAQAHSFE